MSDRVLAAGRDVRVAGHLTATTAGRARNAAGRVRIFADLLLVRGNAGRRRVVIRRGRRVQVRARRVESVAKAVRTSADQGRSAGIFRGAGGMTAGRRGVRHFAEESGAIFVDRLISATCRRRFRAGM